MGGKVIMEGTMQNWHRWMISLGIAVIFGLTAAVSDKDAANLTAIDVLRHVLTAIGPALASLKMTLDKAEQ